MFVTGRCNDVTSGAGASDVGCVCQGRPQRNSSEVSIADSFDVTLFNFNPGTPDLNNCIRPLGSRDILFNHDKMVGVCQANPAG